MTSGSGLEYFEEMGARAVITAFALFNLFLLLDKIFPVISLMPASFTISRTTDPATNPRPLLGINDTKALPNLAFISKGMDIVFVSFNLTIFFLAFRSDLLIAREVSPAFPRPKPTEPFLSPITIATEKENLRPPATTRVTRLILIIFWSNSGLGRPKDRGLRLLFLFSLVFSMFFYKIKVKISTHQHELHQPLILFVQYT